MPVLEQLDADVRERLAQFLRGCKLCAEYYRIHVPGATSDDSSIWETPGIRDLLSKYEVPTYLDIAPTSTIILGVADHIALCEQCRALAESVGVSESVVQQTFRALPDHKEQLEELIEDHRLSQQSGRQQFDEMMNATVSELELLEGCTSQLKNMVELQEMLWLMIVHLGGSL